MLKERMHERENAVAKLSLEKEQMQVTDFSFSHAIRHIIIFFQLYFVVSYQIPIV